MHSWVYKEEVLCLQVFKNIKKQNFFADAVSAF